MKEIATSEQVNLHCTHLLRNAQTLSGFKDMTTKAVGQMLSKCAARLVPSLTDLYTADFDAFSDTPSAGTAVLEQLQAHKRSLEALRNVVEQYTKFAEDETPPEFASEVMATCKKYMDADASLSLPVHEVAISLLSVMIAKYIDAGDWDKVSHSLAPSGGYARRHRGCVAHHLAQIPDHQFAAARSASRIRGQDLPTDICQFASGPKQIG